MSPRTQLVHLGEDAPAFLAIVFVVHDVERLGAHLFASAESHGVDEGLAYGL